MNSCLPRAKVGVASMVGVRTTRGPSRLSIGPESRPLGAVLHLQVIHIYNKL